MNDPHGIGRRGFLKTLALAGGAATQGWALAEPEARNAPPSDQPTHAADVARAIEFPRVFKGRHLSEIAFPLGGVGTGSISLGGRGQLRDWEIFNRPDKGNSPDMVLPTIWVQQGDAKPITKVLERRYLPPFSGTPFWGSMNSAGGLPRFASAVFSGSFPFARIDFSDPEIPVQVQLEAFSPFIPVDPDQSGLPVAILRYRVKNPRSTAAKVSIGYSIANPLHQKRDFPPDLSDGGRTNERRKGAGVEGLLMQNASLEPSHPLAGTFALAALTDGQARLTSLRGWNADSWWTAPLHFWDDFSTDGELGPEPERRNSTGSVALLREIPPNGEAEFTYLLGWHFPNRTPERCGWNMDIAFFVPKAQQATVQELSKQVIGNYYCTRFHDAWAVAEHVAAHFPELTRRTQNFESALRTSTLPGSVLDAATANLSTLVSNTCFRSADGMFHGFEGSMDTAGCCTGNCTHVWNYEATVPYVFPQLSRGLRDIAFGFCTDERGLMDHREILPPGKVHLGMAAADGQMGAIIKLYLDWRMSGDTAWLRKHWPAAKRALEFAWIAGGWDANRDGVMEGAQLNTYDVEFFGPNPLMGCFYLGALRAGEEMAKVVGDRTAAEEYHHLFTRGSQWIDANLFNGEYYIQKVKGIPADQIAPGLSIAPVFEQMAPGMKPNDPTHPDLQMGDGCLSDQFCGQYLAHLAGLGRLLEPANIRKTLESIHRYNYKPSVEKVRNMARTYAINDEAAVIICDYEHGHRPLNAFGYSDEAWTGIEYATAAMMIFEGLIDYGVEAVENVRHRHDGEKRNPWNEPECGHHYARAMSAWGVLVALSGFSYHAGDKSVIARPRMHPDRFSSFWSTGTGWGTYSQTLASSGLQLTLTVTEGQLPCRTISVTGGGAGQTRVNVGASSIPHRVKRTGGDAVVSLDQELTIQAGESLDVLL